MTIAVPNENRKAALMMIGAMACFAVEDLFLKKAASAMPPGQVLVLNGLIAGGLFTVMALMRREKVFSAAALRGTLLARNIAEMVAAFAWIYALAVMPLALASALLQATPLAVTAGAALFLGEKVGWRRWTSIILGFVGVLIILDPWNEGFPLSSFAMLLTVACLALRDLVTRRLPRNVGTLSVAAWGVLACVPAGLALMLLQQHQFHLPSGPEMLVLGLAMTFGVIGYYMVIEAMRIGEVSAVAPFRYSRLVCAVILAILFFGESLTRHVVLGSLLVIFSGIYMFARARKRKARLPESNIPG